MGILRFLVEPIAVHPLSQSVDLGRMSLPVCKYHFLLRPMLQELLDLGAWNCLAAIIPLADQGSTKWSIPGDEQPPVLPGEDFGGSGNPSVTHAVDI